MHQEEGKAGRRSTQSVPLSTEGKFAPASPLGREEREVLKKSLLVLGPFLGKKKKNFWEQDVLLRPVQQQQQVYGKKNETKQLWQLCKCKKYKISSLHKVNGSKKVCEKDGKSLRGLTNYRRLKRDKALL